ncbi:hypothetical protein GCM10022398_16860 [Acetobacter lovaniensis]|nr:hypothetical protein AA0474_2543 [Acetobacter lovaniensis NRIC 0474]
MHLFGQASLRMEQVLWPEDYERMTHEVQETLLEANDPNVRLHSRRGYAGNAGTHRPSARQAMLIGCACIDAGSEP